MNSIETVLYRAIKETQDVGRLAEVALIANRAGLKIEFESDHPVIRKYQGKSVEYNNELAKSERIDHKHGHALLTGGPMPNLSLPKDDGYELTHAILFASNFGEHKLIDMKAVLRVSKALSVEKDMALIGEYLICLYILGQPIEALSSKFKWDPKGDLHTALVGALLLAIQ